MNNGQISGRNIYTDKNRTFYYDNFSKNLYCVGKEDIKKLYLYKNRFILVALAVVLCTDLVFTWPIAIAFGGILLITLEVIFWRTFFSKLRTVSMNKHMNRQSISTSIMQSKEKGKTILKAVLYLAFSILVILNSYLQKSSIPIYICSGLLSLISGYYSILHLFCFIKMYK